MAINKSSVAKPAFLRFKAGEDGAVTVEFVLWLPLILAVMGFIADASLAFGSRSTIMRVLQDTNRAVSVGKITDLTEAEAQLTAAIAGIAPNAIVETTVDQGVITSVVTVPIRDLTSIGIIAKLHDFDLVIASQHLSEG